MKPLYIAITFLFFATKTFAEDEVSIHGEYSCKPWCTLSYEAIKIDGNEFIHTRYSDMLCAELPCDPWSDDYPLDGSFKVKSNKVYLINEKYKSGKLKLYHVSENEHSYLLTKKEYKQWRRGSSLDGMGLRRK